MLWQPGILPTYFLMFLSTIPVAPMMTGIIIIIIIIIIFIIIIVCCKFTLLTLYIPT